MKLNHTNPLKKQLDSFDKQLKAILLHDLSQFRQAKGRFLRNSGDSKLGQNADLLVA